MLAVIQEVMRSRLQLLLVLAVAGCLYGIVSAAMNQNPYDSRAGGNPPSPEERHLAWHWNPSPFWLPSYLLCKCPPNGIGISHTRSGYIFRSQAERVIYFVSSGLVGAALAVLGGVAVKRLSKRKKQVE